MDKGETVSEEDMKMAQVKSSENEAEATQRRGGGGGGGQRFNSIGEMFTALDKDKNGKLTKTELEGNRMASMLMDMASDKEAGVTKEEIEKGFAAMRSRGGNRGGRGGGGGAFNIPPGKVGKVGVKTVCLEHGKKDPKSYIDYKIQPLSKLNNDPKIAEMMTMLANDEVAQPVAQAAAWNVTDDKSWQELSMMNRVESMNGYFERFFTRNQLLFAQQVVTVAEQRAIETTQENAQSEESGSYNND